MRSVVLPIIGLNIVFFLMKILIEPFTSLFLLDSSRVLLEPYRLLTSMFLHGSVSHILFNMFGLLIFGPILESIIGPRRFLYLYIGSGLFAGIIGSFIYPLALGASGAIFGMLGALIYLLPNLKILLFFIIPMPLWVAGILWVFLDVFGLFSGEGNIANAAHLAGMAVGLSYGYYLKKPRQTKPKNKIKTSQDIAMTDEEINEYLKNNRI